MAHHIAERRPSRAVSILDPCVGPHTFPAALAGLGALRVDDRLIAIDADPAMRDSTAAWMARHEIGGEALCGDYLTANTAGVDLAILNPPYLRQEWIDAGATYRPMFRDSYGVDVPGTANLYVYFLVKTIADLRPGGSFSAIIPATWRATRFGQWLHAYVNAHCSSVVVEEVPDQPFDGALIDGTILTATVERHRATVTVPPLRSRSLFERVDGFVDIDTAFESKRGLRLKQAAFFMCGREEARTLGATPFVKHIRYIDRYVVADPQPQKEARMSSQPFTTCVGGTTKRADALG